MTVNKSIVIACGAVCLAFAALALVAGAQVTPASQPVRVAAAPPVAGSSKAPGAPAVAAPAAADSGKQLVSRETYNYLGTGRRDPFISLMNTEELRPLYNDLKLVAVAYDAS